MKKDLASAPQIILKLIYILLAMNTISFTKLFETYVREVKI